MTLRYKKGFTLIELLVVISVIALLSTFAIIALDNARKKARDARRISDIAQIQKALDLYYNEHGEFPISGNCGATVPNGVWCNSVQSLSGGHWIRNGTTVNLGNFLTNDPVSPTPGASASFSTAGVKETYYYFANGYGGSGQWYMIIFGLEDSAHPLQNEDGVIACNGQIFDYGASWGGNNGVITIGRNCQK